MTGVTGEIKADATLDTLFKSGEKELPFAQATFITDRQTFGSESNQKESDLGLRGGPHHFGQARVELVQKMLGRFLLFLGPGFTMVSAAKSKETLGGFGRHGFVVRFHGAGGMKESAKPHQAHGEEVEDHKLLEAHFLLGGLNEAGNDDLPGSKRVRFRAEEFAEFEMDFLRERDRVVQAASHGFGQDLQNLDDIGLEQLGSPPGSFPEILYGGGGDLSAAMLGGMLRFRGGEVRLADFLVGII
ncbi:MAG: hypothetical protein SNJ84_01555 [Verrucomicrobiia bacterium]